MTTPRCGVCRKLVKHRNVKLGLTTQYGRGVTIVLHDGCATALQGQLAFALRDTEHGALKIASRARKEASQIAWTPEALKGLRVRLGISQMELAQRLGCARQTVFVHEQPGAQPWYGMSHKLIPLEVLASQNTGITLREWMEVHHGKGNVRRDAGIAHQKGQGSTGARRERIGEARAEHGDGAQRSAGIAHPA